MMNEMKRFNKLDQEDKDNLTTYMIFNEIIDTLKNDDKEININDILEIKDLVMDVYLDDEYYNYSPTKIADYITIGYLDNNISLDKLEESDRTDMYMGIDNDDYDWLLENEMER